MQSEISYREKGKFGNLMVGNLVIGVIISFDQYLCLGLKKYQFCCSIKTITEQMDSYVLRELYVSISSSIIHAFQIFLGLSSFCSSKCDLTTAQ